MGNDVFSECRGIPAATHSDPMAGKGEGWLLHVTGEIVAIFSNQFGMGLTNQNSDSS